MPIYPATDSFAFTAVVVGVSGVTTRTAVVRHRDGAGVERESTVGVNGWDDGSVSYWPPQAGDVVRVKTATSVVLTARPRGVR